MTLKPGDLGIDYSGLRPGAASVAHNGARFIIRYSAGVGNTSPKSQWKLCGLGEIHDAVAHGVDFIANSEWYEGRIAEGAAAGAADGAADLVFWKARGYARGAVIMVSWDAAPSKPKWLAVAAYLRAYRKATGGYYRVGIYGGSPLLEWLLLTVRFADVGWRPNAGSWSNDKLPYQPDTSTPSKRAALVARALKATKANIWQTGNYWYQKGADENIILRTPVWSHMDALAADAPKPSPKPTLKPPPKPKPSLRRRWPSYMKRGDYFGLITGPTHSRGGYNTNERPDVSAIQTRLTQLGYPVKVDGRYGPATAAAVNRFKGKIRYPRNGKIGKPTWIRLFTS